MKTLSASSDSSDPGFYTPLVLEDQCSSKIRFTVHEPLIYRTAGGLLITVPAGFRTNLASIPRLFWRILPPIGSYDAAAVVHDYLYTTHMVGDSPISKGYADDIFYEAMLASGTAKWKAKVMYSAVNMFGFNAWGGT